MTRSSATQCPVQVAQVALDTTPLYYFGFLGLFMAIAIALVRPASPDVLILSHFGFGACMVRCSSSILTLRPRLETFLPRSSLASPRSSSSKSCTRCSRVFLSGSGGVIEEEKSLLCRV